MEDSQELRRPPGEEDLGKLPALGLAWLLIFSWLGVLRPRPGRVGIWRGCAVAASLVFGGVVATLPFEVGALVGAGSCGRPSLETGFARSIFCTFGSGEAVDVSGLSPL